MWYIFYILIGILLYIILNNIDGFIGDYYLVGYKNSDGLETEFKLIKGDSMDNYLQRIFNTQDNPTQPGLRPNNLSPFVIYGFMAIDWTIFLLTGVITRLEHELGDGYTNEWVDYTNNERTQEELLNHTRDLIDNYDGLPPTQFTEFANRRDLFPAVQDFFTQTAARDAYDDFDTDHYNVVFADFNYQPELAPVVPAQPVRPVAQPAQPAQPAPAPAQRRSWWQRLCASSARN